MRLTVEQLEQRIHLGWEQCPTPRPYITLKKETYTKLKSVATFIDTEFGEWQAIPDGVMRGGMHPKRRQRDFTDFTVSKEEFHTLYLIENLSVKEIASKFGCHPFKVKEKIKEFDLRKPMDLKLKLMANTNYERYGCEYATQDPEIRVKMAASRDAEQFKESYKETMLERYGVDNGFRDPGIKNRAKQTMMDKYGTQHALQADECREKFQATIRKNYGDESLLWCGNNVKEIREKSIATNLERYGVEFPFQSELIQEQITRTVIEKYGVDRIAKSPEIQDKIRKSILARYGVHHLSLPEMREIIKQTSLERYGHPCSLQNPEVAQKSYETRLKNDSFNSSAPEKEIRCYVQSLIPEIRHNVRNIIAPYELDIVIPSKLMAIEYNGLYHHSEACVDNNYHAKKLSLCNEVGYRLISIFEHEWYGRQTAVKSRLKAILGCNSKIVGARETKFSIASEEEVLPFLNEFHVQGGVRFDRAFKLTHSGLIVAIMTFSRHHRQTSKELVLNRFCVREDYSIVGGIAKLLKNANIKEPIVSYSDNRWSEGDIYKRLGFILETQIRPDYFYIGKSRIHSKQSMKKTKEESMLGVSEHELRLAQGYLRVYDCGKKRWRLFTE